MLNILYSNRKRCIVFFSSFDIFHECTNEKSACFEVRVIFYSAYLHFLIIISIIISIVLRFYAWNTKENKETLVKIKGNGSNTINDLILVTCIFISKYCHFSKFVRYLNTTSVCRKASFIKTSKQKSMEAICIMLHQDKKIKFI